MHVCHKCDNRKCVRLSHLFVGTPRENNEDQDAKGRRPKGDDHSNSKLTAAIVHDARLRYAAGGVSQQELANENSVSQVAMSAALRGKTWRHVE